MEPTSVLGRTLKPFVEESVRDWVQTAQSEGWFRQIMYADDDAEGKGRIYFGPKGRFGSLPLSGGIAALTAAGGAAHVEIAGWPTVTWVLNEMIDEIGPALRNAYESGRTPTKEEINQAQEKLEELLQTKVLVVVNGGTYTIHHAQCFHPPVLAARPRIVRAYLEAAAMGARPTADCPVCHHHLGGILSKINKTKQEADHVSTPSSRAAPADFLMQLSQQQRNTINDYVAAWEAEGPEATQLIDHLMLKLTSVTEAQLLASARSLTEFKSLMRRTLEPKTVSASVTHAVKQVTQGIARAMSDADPSEPSVLQLELYRTQRRTAWQRFRDLFRVF